MVKKLVGLGAGVSAAIAMAVIGAAHANAAPTDVTGETYNNALQDLRNAGFTSVIFGGSVGGDVTQGNCIVSDESALPGGWVRLRLNCTKAAALAAAGPAAPPGAHGAPGAPAGPVAVVPGAAPVPGGFPQVGVPVAVG
jgi:hypothetical protein